MLGSMLEFAKGLGLVTDNVARGIKRPPVGKSTRFLSIDEIERLGAAMRKAESDGEGSTGIAATKFLLLSGCRRMEALALPVDWIDTDAKCIRFQDTEEWISDPSDRVTGTGSPRRPNVATAGSFLPTRETATSLACRKY